MDLINNKPWLLWVLLFFLPPVGIFFLYKLKKFNTLLRAVLTVVFCFVFLIELGIAFGDQVEQTGAPSVPAISQNADNLQGNSETQSSIGDDTSTLKVHFIDVGQADSILIQSGNAAMLIDGGNNEDGSAVVNYLKAQGVTELAAIVATHPHEDHIGGLDTVIKAFATKAVYMPNATNTTITFEDFINAVNSSGAKRIQAKAGVTLSIDGFTGTFLGPRGSGYDNLNDNSAVLKLTHGSTSFLFTGDAEEHTEKEMLKNGNLAATVLKVGHHGSYTATSSSFLKDVSPKYAVISSGKDNSYGHPHTETLDKLAAAGVKVYRTDQSGTIVMESDGNTITVNKVN